MRENEGTEPVASQISTVERLDAEMSTLQGRLVAMGMDQGTLNTIQLAALVRTLIDKGLISEQEWGEHAVKMLKDVERQARKQALLARP